MTAERNHLFDAIRGLAALLIVMYHLAENDVIIVKSGFLAVDLFFVLSGYVVAQSYERRLRQGMSFRSFMETRLIRLYPLLLLGTVLGFGEQILKLALSHTEALSGPQLVAALLTNLVVLPAPIGVQFMFPLDAPLWSLFFELIANIVFALLAFRCRNPFLVAVSFVSAMVLIFSAYKFQTADLGWSWHTAWAGFARVGFGFSVGHLFYRLFRPGRPACKTWWSVAVIVAIAALLIARPPETIAVAFWLIASIVLCPLTVLLATRIELPARATGVAAILGDLSYPLYAIHSPLLYLMSFVFRRLGVPNEAFVIGLPLIVAAAYIVTRYYDLPVRRMLSRRLSLRMSSLPEAV